MSYISIIVPAFHLNTTDKNDIYNYCCSQFNITQDNFSLIEIKSEKLKDNINYGIIFNESNLSLNKIEQLIYERNCIQNLSEKAFESLQLLSKKISNLENIINNLREEKNNSEKKNNKEMLGLEKINDNINSDIAIDDNKIEFSEKSINKIKMEFQNMVDDIELLNTNSNGKYIQKYIHKDITLDNSKKEENEKIQNEEEILPQG